MLASVNLVAFIDDDDVLRDANVQTLRLAGFEVMAFASAEAALAALPAGFPGVVVSDIRMPGLDGSQLFRRLKVRDEDLPVILITGHADVSEAVEAMHDGVYDFVAKPYAPERLVSSVRRAMEKRRLVLENRSLRTLAVEAQSDWPLIGQTAVMERLRATLRQLANADVDVLLEGETGVGKELAARALHAWGRRRDREFVAVDCAALPAIAVDSELFGHELGAFSGAVRQRAGRIQQADRGTLFLDEIETLAPEAQGKFLRVLEEREVTPIGSNRPQTLDLRVVAAGKSDLSDAVAAGTFREDLFHRLDVVRIRIPPLRERREDVPLLFAHFLARACERLEGEPPKIDDKIRWRLYNHDWPGNVRELSHYAQRVALGLADQSGDAPADPPPLPARVATYEAHLIEEALAAGDGDVRKALEVLRIPRKTFYDKIERHGIDLARHRRRSR
ncbi:sigma-54 dependent transcriptional regulator [Caulobacter sp. FWC2]|uniref:sigma-54-dependent transcriptional regulator n=1 Tax=Caulobacter sp. FWC2 TaxID=69664 RepID=UPI000C146506|nr:sigma-54 dependent transcriptional regulator [Caulobacter sp. FWC2]PIB92264.1 Fis family transcriptional regulator [Caulobacter sp. FWC2]